jgi:hypothetical protein
MRFIGAKKYLFDADTFLSALSETVFKHIALSATRSDAGAGSAFDHALRHDLPVAAGSACGDVGGFKNVSTSQ